MSYVVVASLSVLGAYHSVSFFFFADFFFSAQAIDIF